MVLGVVGVFLAKGIRIKGDAVLGEFVSDRPSLGVNNFGALAGFSRGHNVCEKMCVIPTAGFRISCDGRDRIKAEARGESTCPRGFSLEKIRVLGSPKSCSLVLVSRVKFVRAHTLGFDGYILRVPSDSIPIVKIMGPVVGKLPLSIGGRPSAAILRIAIRGEGCICLRFYRLVRGGFLN